MLYLSAGGDGKNYLLHLKLMLKYAEITEFSYSIHFRLSAQLTSPDSSTNQLKVEPSRDETHRGCFGTEMLTGIKKCQGLPN